MMFELLDMKCLYSAIYGSNGDEFVTSPIVLHYGWRCLGSIKLEQTRHISTNIIYEYEYIEDTKIGAGTLAMVDGAAHPASTVFAQMKRIGLFLSTTTIYISSKRGVSHSPMRSYPKKKKSSQSIIMDVNAHILLH